MLIDKDRATDLLIDLRIEKDELVAKNDFSIMKNSYKKIQMRRYGNTFTFLFNNNNARTNLTY